MPNEAPPTQPDGEGEKIVSLRLSESIRDRVKSASITTGITKANIYRLAIDRGVGILVDQLTSKTTNTSAEGGEP